MRSRTPWRVTALLGAVAIAAAIVGAPANARAHLGSRKYLRAEVTDAGVVVEAEVEAVDASMELGLGPEVDEAALRARAPQLARWLREGLRVRAGDAPCEAEAEAPELVTRDALRFVRVVLSYRCAGEGARVLRDETVFPDDPQHEAIVQVAWAAESERDAQILRRGRQEVELGAPAGAATLTGRFLWEGMLHFATGYDHVLFLLSLVLAAGFVTRKKGLRPTLKDVAWLVTAFTLGHSVTLIAAALGVVVLPSQPVEIAIAASIVIVATLNVWRPEQRGPMPWLALGFGLIHGFGFSSVLAELGLPRDQTVLALVAFNVGIELAQLAFVAVVLGPIAWAARQRGYRHLVRGGSVLIGLLAIFWVVERIAGA
ncbi:MAG TPA: HupE/UreJ family protein [Polyangiaceae bacterium LLY-WYZ-15_(1-7)]|nr:hypothetical protein [Sandaracinus sp.]HJL03562.1 HupE/UreJ family protein [Polyangiaceae bacterium LLY-WYZ-15_(1-7)]HJL09396.1 HupE/UreJ family protein [Polyangiaceae bacterium LLY-WYZ-15_(1-7)]HJL34035.1 HupE/UreJ family protein [Polyangiaceae bacterium LLY-WYZ-15_(1-7)]